MFRRAAAGKQLHHEFAYRAAAVDGELTDVVGNMAIVKAFGGISREHRRFEAAVGQEMAARQRSLRYLEQLRIAHALVTVALTIGLLAWVLLLWQQGHATTGDVILVCTLGLSVLHATRDLAIALVDVTQHTARFAEALQKLLVPHQLCDRPGAKTLARGGISVNFDKVDFAYPECPRLFHGLNFTHRNRPEGRPGRSIRRRQEHDLRPDPALLRHRGRAHPDRQPGRHGGHAAEPARGDRRGAAGHLAVPPLADREHPLCPPGGQRRGGDGGGGGGALRLHRRAAAGARHDRRRSRRAAVGRAAPAHRAGPRVPEGRAVAAAR